MVNQSICKCMCHTKGMTIRHCRPCCNHTYKKYLNADFSLDEEAYKEIVDER